MNRYINRVWARISAEAQFVLMPLVVACIIIVALLILPSYGLNPINWIVDSLKDGISTLHDSIRAHPLEWFCWTVVTLMAITASSVVCIAILLAQQFWPESSAISELRRRSMNTRLHPAFGMNRGPSLSVVHDLQNMSPFERARHGDFSQMPDGMRPQSHRED